MLIVKFVTHAPDAPLPGFYPSEVLKKVTLSQRPRSVAELMTVLKDKYRHLIQHGYKIVTTHSAQYEGAPTHQRNITNTVFYNFEGDSDVYIICRRPRQRRTGFKFI